VSAVEVFLHGPKSASGLGALEKKVALVYAQAVVAQIKSLACPREEKARLLGEIISARAQRN
jgi:hypothetical protein